MSYRSEDPIQRMLADMMRGGIPKEMKQDFNYVLGLVRSMRTAATSDEYGFDPREVLADVQSVVSVIAERVITQLLEKQNQEKLLELGQQYEAARGRIEGKYHNVPSTATVGVSEGGFSKVVHLNGSNQNVRNPYHSLENNPNAWKKHSDLNNLHKKEHATLFLLLYQQITLRLIH